MFEVYIKVKQNFSESFLKHFLLIYLRKSFIALRGYFYCFEKHKSYFLTFFVLKGLYYPYFHMFCFSFTFFYIQPLESLNPVNLIEGKSFYAFQKDGFGVKTCFR